MYWPTSQGDSHLSRNNFGDKIQEAAEGGKTWSYIYDQNHRPTSIIGSNGRITSKVAPSSASNPN
jgi:YD repeat-containing protein